MDFSGFSSTDGGRRAQVLRPAGYMHGAGQGLVIDLARVKGGHYIISFKSPSKSSLEGSVRQLVRPAGL